jgi:hypothetical protein
MFQGRVVLVFFSPQHLVGLGSVCFDLLAQILRSSMPLWLA